MKVIVVEDNPVYNDYICNLLKKGGFDTAQAYRLSTAKKLLMKAGEEYIVLADLRLPDGEGIDLLRWMRKEEKPQPFIVMTDYAEVHTAVESMKLGSADYIPKLLVEDRLVPLIRLLHKAQEQKRQGQVPILPWRVTLWWQQNRLPLFRPFAVLVWCQIQAVPGSYRVWSAVLRRWA